LCCFPYSEVRRRESQNPALEEFALQTLDGL
jgi:two-component system, OmpR family, sensor histidine kinase QseC